MRSLSLAEQLLSAARYIDRQTVEAAECAAWQPSQSAAGGAVDSAVLEILRRSTTPLLAAEVKERLPEDDRPGNMAGVLRRLMLRGFVRRRGREGKYRYALN